MSTSEQFNQELHEMSNQVVSNPGCPFVLDLVERTGGTGRFVAIHCGAYSCDGLYIPYSSNPAGWEPCTRSSFYRLKRSDVVIHAFPEIFHGAFEILKTEDGQWFKKLLGEGVTVNGEPLAEQDGLKILPKDVVKGKRLVKKRKFWFDKTRSVTAKNMFTREVVLGTGKRVLLDPHDWSTFQLTTLTIALRCFCSTTFIVAKFEADLTSMWDDDAPDPFTALQAKATSEFRDMSNLRNAKSFAFTYKSEDNDVQVIRTKEDLLKAYRFVFGSQCQPKRHKRLDLEVFVF